MIRTVYYTLAFILAFFLYIPCSDAFGKTEVRERSASREDAVRFARQGDYTTALSIFRRLRESEPRDQAVLLDYLVILGWAGQYADAAALSASLRPGQIPEYAVGQIAASLRKAGKLATAQHWYDQAAGRFPHNPDIAIGRALTLGDRGRTARGLDALRAYARTHPERARKAVSEAMAYLQRGIEPPRPYVQPPRFETGYRTEQDAAVASARQGDLTGALSKLAKLNALHPEDAFLLGDYLVLLQWNKENEKILALSGRMRLDLAPAYAVEAVAGALTRVRGPHDAETFMKTALAAQRRNPELLVAAALVMADNGDPYTALLYLDEAERSRTPGLGARIETARKKIGAPCIAAMDDLARAESMLDRDLGNQDAMNSRARALLAGGGAREARDAANTPPGSSVPSAAREDIRRAAGLQRVAWGEQSDTPRYLDERSRRLKAALADLDALASSPQCAASEACRNRTKMGRIQALYDLGRTREAADEYETVKDSSQPLTPAAQLAAAGAYMSLREPDRAAEVYGDIVARQDAYDPPLSPDDLFRAETGLFWAHLEAERLSAAFGQAQAVYTRAVRPAGGLPPFEDDDWKKRSAAATLGYAALYTGELDKAENVFTDMARRAPAMLEVQSGLASTYRSRGLPRAALDTVERAAVFAPGDIDLAVQTAEALLDIQDWRKAKAIIDALEPYAPWSQSVRTLFRRWETHTLFESRLDGGWAKTFGGRSPGISGYSQTPFLEGRLYSPPIASDWRAYAGFGLASGDFAEGRARRTVALGGMEYRTPWLTASLEARNDHVETNTLGLSLYGVFTPGDHWLFPFSLEKDSPDTPLRARGSGVTADSARLGAGYRWNESRSMNVSLGGMNFSDGNQRMELSASFTQRLWHWHTQYLDGTATAYTSYNSKNADRPYFNPEADLALGGSLTYGAILWRDYDTSLSHAVTGGLGSSSQMYYGTGLIWDVSYSQTLDWTDRFSLTYGVGASRRIYDGDPENNLNTFFSLMWKF